MHRSPKIKALVLAASVLALAACAERDDGDDTLAERDARDTPAATAPATQPATPAAAPGQPPLAGQPGQLTDADRQFLTQAGAANQHELQAAQSGIERAASPEVRAFAERMQRDHTQLGQRMQPLMQQAGVVPGTMAPDMPGLDGASGADFDRAFMQMMVTDHEGAVMDFERAANDPANSAAVRAAAGEALPTLRSHLQDAQALRDSLEGGDEADTTDTGATDTDA